LPNCFARVAYWANINRNDGSTRIGAKNVGQAIANYYPSIISEADFYRVSQSLTTRKAGRRGKMVSNLFSGLCVDHAGDGMVMVSHRGNNRYLVARSAYHRAKGKEYVAFRYQAIETAILGILPRLTIGARQTQSSSILDVLADQLATVDGKTAKLTAREDTMDYDLYLSETNRLATQRKAILAKIEQAKREQSNKPSDTASETITAGATLGDGYR